ncbi:MAG: (Fe-S)-binding protein [Pirellulales bacterium]|nr:(Fe-S)-binding protein [Pirellulales bacterium]
MVQPPAPEAELDLSFLEHLLASPDGEPILSCMQCGTCSGACPLGHAMEYPPRAMILQARVGDMSPVLSSPSVWMCVGCYTCTLRCPREIDLTDTLWPAVRDEALQKGMQPPAELQTAFQNLYMYGNVLGQSPRKRLKWADGLDVPVLDLTKNPQPVEIIWLVGCYPSYYPRNQVVSREFARILTKLEVSWGVLGVKEKSLGDCDRLFGEEGLFETLVESNNELFERHQFKELILLDPHSFRALQQFYPRYGVDIPAQHYVTYLAERIDQLRPLLQKPVNATVTYHDNCCVGRRCACFDAPRELLEAIPGISLVEMARNKDNALCCGGGGGGMWLDAHITEHGGHRLSDERIRQAAETGANVLAVSCPYELSRFEDSAKVVGVDDQLVVRDIIELLAESMGLSEKEKT